MHRRNAIATLIIFSIITSGLLFQGCNRSSERDVLVLATTTSVQDTGLLDYLLPKFEKKYRVKVKPIAVGSGEAIEMGAKGDADVLLVHSPDDEKRFMADGKGGKRKTFMYNHFLIVGPKEDPAGLKGTKELDKALNKLAAGNGVFVSRGDESGTHKRELKLWGSIGRKPEGKGYITSGQGMGETLQIANEKKAYTLSDTGTYVTLINKLDMDIIYKDGGKLLNEYSVITINPKRFKNINSPMAEKFYRWLTSSEVLDLIGKFKNGKVFTPIYEGIPANTD